MQTMRDALLSSIHSRMKSDRNIYFVTADFGSPVLDSIRNDFGDRFLNVGIAEQNLINVSTGLALQGFKVFAYAIAPFLTMRAFEQIRNNLSMMSQHKPLNVNIVGVGAGFSYDISGPTHHCLEDLSVIYALPNIKFISPCDTVSVSSAFEFCMNECGPKYLRFDSKPLPAIYKRPAEINLKTGFCELQTGRNSCIVSTGYMTHTALSVYSRFQALKLDIGVIDVFSLKDFNKKALNKILLKYRNIITLAEGFRSTNGLYISTLNLCANSHLKVFSVGAPDSYSYNVGKRSRIHLLNKMDVNSVIRLINSLKGKHII